MERLSRQLFLTMKLVRDRLDERLATHGGSVQQWVLLRALATNGKLSHGELAARVYLAAPTLTHHLDRMETAGFITRARDVVDRRVVHVSITPAGARHFADLEAVADVADADVRALLSTSEAETLRALLTQLHERLLQDTDEGEQERVS
jgi:MarR family transcriptional regulator, organic hydroperoxide resistance regulator